MSQLPDISETITVGDTLNIQAPKRVTATCLARQDFEDVGNFIRRALRAPLLITLGPFNVESEFFSLYSSGAGVAKAKSSYSDQISPKPAGRENGREGLLVSLLPDPEKLTKEKGECGAV